MAGVFLKGNLVQVLRNALQLSTFSTLSSGTTDPSVTALAGVAGDVYFSTSGTYQKNDSGVTTNWTRFASGGTLPTFTDKSVPFSNSSGVLTEDNANFKYDSGSSTLTVANLIVSGTSTSLQTTNTVVKDKLITLNSGGAAASAGGTGFEIEENSIITGYLKTHTDRASFKLLAPATAGIITLTPGAGGFTIDQGSHNPVTIGTANGLSLSTQVLSMALSSGSTVGALAAADFTNFSNKEPAITAGTTSQYWRGDKSFQTLDTDAVAEAGNKYYLDSRARAALSGVAPISYNSSTGAISITQSATAANGYLSSVDWNTFNNKQPAGSYITALTGDVTAAGPGSSAATVAFVGGSSAANVATAEALANAATSANTASTIVKRDGSGNFTAGTITAALTGIASGNLRKITGDIDPGTFSLSDNQSSAANVTGLAFANGVVRGAHILYSVAVIATAELYEFGSLYCVQKNGSWEINQVGTGDPSLVEFTITSAGQIQYTTPAYAGFVSAVVKFRAVTSPV